jgi:hypothetical protein
MQEMRVQGVDPVGNTELAVALAVIGNEVIGGKGQLHGRSER